MMIAAAVILSVVVVVVVGAERRYVNDISHKEVIILRLEHLLIGTIKMSDYKQEKRR